MPQITLNFLRGRLPLRLLVLFLSIAFIFCAPQPVAAQAPSIYLPALEALDGTELGLALVNTASADAQVTVTARTYQGALIADTAIVNPSTLKVPASGKLEIRIADLFGTGISNQHGWL